MSYDQFPDDENGQVLRKMIASGDDLSKPRVINFSVLFDSVNAARQFVAAAEGLGAKVIIEAEAPYENVIDVTVQKEMIPKHRDITEFESKIENIASEFGGRNDGWGCFSM